MGKVAEGFIAVATKLASFEMLEDYVNHSMTIEYAVYGYDRSKGARTGEEVLLQFETVTYRGRVIGVSKTDVIREDGVTSKVVVEFESGLEVLFVIDRTDFDNAVQYVPRGKK